MQSSQQNNTQVYVLCLFKKSKKKNKIVISFGFIDFKNKNLLGDKLYENRGYIFQKQTGQPIHRILLGCQPHDKQIVDHKDRNKLNNCMYNLRIVSIAQNSRNVSKKKEAKSQYFGVSKHNQKWAVKHNYVYYGLFENEQHAAKVYDSIALYFDCEDPRINFKDSIACNKLPQIKKHNNDMKYIKKQNNSQTYCLKIQTNKIKLTKNSQDLPFLKNLRDKQLLMVEKKPFHSFIFKKNHVEVQIGTQIMLLSKEDCDDLLEFKFSIRGGYPFIYHYNSLITVHKYIMNKIYGQNQTNLVIDHINKNKLDARRSNLRFATPSQNAHNTKKKENTLSNFLGVSRHKTGKFQSVITVDGQTYRLGVYETDREAAIAYNIKAIQLHCEYANINKDIDMSGYSLINDRLHYQNQKVYNKLPKSGYFGVCFHKKVYEATISFQQKRTYVGYYQTSFTAALARELKIIQLNLQNHVQMNNICFQNYILNDNNYPISKDNS